MNNKNRILKLAAGTAIAFSALLSPLGMTANSASNQGYVTLSTTMPSDTANKTEVLEFFAYSCPHCAAADPIVESWSETLPDNIAFNRVPVAFNAGMGDLQRMYYTLEALDRLDLHPKLFDALHKERKSLFDAKALAKWAVDQGISKDEFDATFSSFGVNTKIAKANDLAKAYRIDATPMMAVGGKYVTSPSMTNGLAEMVQQADALVKQLD
ncbi:thiol:disulfide interchange protein DsbA/DsbL [Paenalcaligenes niemegkensis]|uniref:thiol:disulfide interchange protein DsbA/DsbL n=1 Tax=Paenalcaligenes niemegkensis TaxID=2895469 RepID=UPI001EE87B9D|nr:thiol:disulfide interchange protein DsbA/DsbL [Paenalcaligenes niemegkensis]MCQ9618020.1 thiol:disulfide interchange protein DsbA/DsbL [Paenalcaligenes niemegkensis]